LVKVIKYVERLVKGGIECETGALVLQCVGQLHKL